MGLCEWGDHKEEVAGLSGKVEGQSSWGKGGGRGSLL